MRRILLALITGLLLASCVPESEVSAPPTEVDEQQSSGSATEQQQAAQADPQVVEFESEDGTKLVGTYYPPAQQPAPAVVLMHMLNNRRASWEDFANQLYDEGNYAVLTFDFRGHGDSEGEFERELAIADARAALNYVQTFDNVEQGNVVLIGASIGSDAAVDACVEGCVAAVSLSPGGWLGIPYADALSTITDKPVLCVASAEDGSTPATCMSGEDLAMSNYTVQIYEGRAHGTSIFGVENLDPPLPDLITGWLSHNVPA